MEALNVTEKTLGGISEKLHSIEGVVQKTTPNRTGVCPFMNDLWTADSETQSDSKETKTEVGDKDSKTCDDTNDNKTHGNEKDNTTHDCQKESKKEDDGTQEVVADSLASSTQLVKKFSQKVEILWARVQDSAIYRTVTILTQPAHILAILSVLLVAVLVFPSKKQYQRSVYSSFYTFVYLATFAIHFGSQVWMTFVSGLSLYFNLPRHSFGEVQKVLFPRYYTVNSLVGLLSLTAYIQLVTNQLYSLENITQLCAIVISFLVEVVVRLYLAPPLLVLIEDRTQRERKVGCGHEVGSVNLPETLRTCPFYMKTYKDFRRLHMGIAVSNMISICCSVAQLYLINNLISFEIKPMA